MARNTENYTESRQEHEPPELEDYEINENVDFQMQDAQALAEKYLDPQSRPETDPKDIEGSDNAWKAAKDRSFVQSWRGESWRLTSPDKDPLEEQVMVPGTVRAMCYAHDFMLENTTFLQETRAVVEGNPVSQDIREGESTTDAAQAFAGRHGEGWQDRYKDLIHTAESKIMAGKYMVAEGLAHSDPKTTAAGIEVMGMADWHLKVASHEDFFEGEFVAQDVGWKSNWQGMDTDPLAHAEDRLARIDEMAKEMGGGNQYAEGAAAGYFAKTTADLDAVAVTEQLEASLGTLDGQNQEAVDMLAEIARTSFNTSRFPEIKEAAEAMASEDRDQTALAYHRIGEAQEALAAAAFVLSNCPEEAGLGNANQEDTHAAARVSGEMRNFEWAQENGPDWVTSQIVETLFPAPEGSNEEYRHDGNHSQETATILAKLCAEGQMERCIETARNHPEWNGFKST